ncbi:hypothetical protein SEA_YINZ_10 [Mycobacterium phage Yinz]|nr:hypothetical protein SEA_YINZ_10 [Mycobacterium phage Yinz]
MADLGEHVLVGIVYVLAVMRITRLINWDAVLDRPRSALIRFTRGNPTVVYFLTCPWCVGFWLTLATAWLPLYASDHAVVRYLGVALAASMLIGLFAPLSADDDLEMEEDKP